MGDGTGVSLFKDILNRPDCIKPHSKEEKQWKELISPRSFTEKKSTALWKECLQETAARFLREEEPRAEQDLLTD